MKKMSIKAGMDKARIAAVGEVWFRDRMLSRIFIVRRYVWILMNWMLLFIVIGLLIHGIWFWKIIN